MTADMEEARRIYFEVAGGQESDIGPRDDPGWYWRRAAKILADQADGRRVKAIQEASDLLECLAIRDRHKPDLREAWRAAAMATRSLRGCTEGEHPVSVRWGREGSENGEEEARET